MLLCMFPYQASEREILWVMRIVIVLVGAAAATIGIAVNSVYALSYLCVDLVYVILFPQLLCCVHIPFTNVYGSMAGFIVGMFFRLASGEVFLNFKPLFEYPGYDKEAGVQYFPYKTLSMLVTLITVVLVSLCARMLIKHGILPPESKGGNGINGSENSSGEIKEPFIKQEVIAMENNNTTPSETTDHL